MKHTYREKLASEDMIFSHIHRGDRIFITWASGLCELRLAFR